jgi:hypothetical protein
MGSQPAEDHIERFVLELLCTGAMLGELVADLSAALPTNACPGEEPRAVVIEMLCGTIGTARLARDLSRRIHGEDGDVGRTYG